MSFGIHLHFASIGNQNALLHICRFFSHNIIKKSVDSTKALVVEYFSSTQPVSMLNSQESNVFIMLSSNIGSVNKKNSRLIPVRNQTGVSYAPENRQLTVDK